MAEAIVSVALDKIADLLGGEVIFLHGVRDEVVRLQAELKRMQCFLKDADSKPDQDERVRNWVAEIRDLAYDAEDVLDTFLLKIGKTNAGVCPIVKTLVSKQTKFLQLYSIGSKIKSMRATLTDISNSQQTYGIKFTNEAGEGTNSVTEMQRRIRRTDPDDEERDIISTETTMKAVLEQLKQEEGQVRVVSIVGMGGLGKTTLAKKIYNHSDVKLRFDCRSWAFISQKFSPSEVLSGILLQISPGENIQCLSSMTEEVLVKRLKNALKQKRFLVVLDDIWKEEAWDYLKQAFPEGKKGSKVLFTTRIREVALYADPRSCPVVPPFLTDEQGWQLLRRKAFVENCDETTQCYMSEFERLGKEMVRRCGGLPLAIAVLGGLLSNKSLKEWEVVQADINAQFVNLEQRSRYAGINWILALSYYDLPFRLKPCFLYLSQFPEDSEIKKRELVQMWIAEGFIQQGEGGGEKTMEDVGEGYLEELMSRSMIQVGQRNYIGIGVKTCHMHDLMRDMCLEKAKEERFLGVIDRHQQNSATRRIAVYCGEIRIPVVPTKECSPYLRSLIYVAPRFSYSNVLLTKSKITFILRNFKLLRVLKLSNVGIIPGYVPREIGNLIHLRYFGLRENGFQDFNFFCPAQRILPRSIRNLKSLYSLDFRGNVGRVPDVLWKLECLGHLYLNSTYYLFGKLRLDTLRNLQTLKEVSVKDLLRKDALLKLTNLRVLKINFEELKEAKVVLKSPIFESGQLRSLSMMKYSFSGLELLLQCQLLTKLKLEGAYGFSQCEIDQDPMAILEKLPNLRFLSIHTYDNGGTKMVCSSHHFPRLEILSLELLYNIEEWEIQEGAMPCLKILNLYHIKKLRMIPEGIKFVTSLQELNVKDLRVEFLKRITVKDGVEGEDFYKVRHIPSLTAASY